MSKRVPVYLSEEELEHLVEALKFNNIPRNGIYPNRIEINLQERLEAELATFEE